MMQHALDHGPIGPQGDAALRGEDVQVKILGIIALMDEGETDWKVIRIKQMNDIEDVEKHFPGLLEATNEWFKIYKITDGKPENKFAFNGEAKNAVFAVNIVNETHEFWKGLVSKEIENYKISCSNTNVPDSPEFANEDQRFRLQKICVRRQKLSRKLKKE